MHDPKELAQFGLLPSDYGVVTMADIAAAAKEFERLLFLAPGCLDVDVIKTKVWSGGQEKYRFGIEVTALQRVYP